MLLPMVLGAWVLPPPPEAAPNKASQPHTAGPCSPRRGRNRPWPPGNGMAPHNGMATCGARRLQAAAPSPREEGPRIPTTCREELLPLLTHEQGTRTEASSRCPTVPQRLPALSTDGQERAGNFELCRRSWALSRGSTSAFLPTALGVQCDRSSLRRRPPGGVAGRTHLRAAEVPALWFQEP